MTIFFEVAPEPLPYDSIFLTTSMPLVTLPKTTCFPSSHAVLTVQRKNCCCFGFYRPRERLILEEISTKKRCGETVGDA